MLTHQTRLRPSNGTFAQPSYHSKSAQHFATTLRGPVVSARYSVSSLETDSTVSLANARPLNLPPPVTQLLSLEVLPHECSDIPKQVNLYPCHLDTHCKTCDLLCTVEKDFVHQGESNDTGTCIERRGEILRLSSPVKCLDLDNLCNVEVSKHYIMEGLLGMRNATLSNESYEQWKGGQSMPKFKNVMVNLQHCQDDINQVKTLEEIVGHPVPEVRVCASQFFHFAESNYTFLLTDDLEDMPCKGLTSDSIIHKALSNLCLQHATMIVTGIASSAKHLNIAFCRRTRYVEILQFKDIMPFEHFLHSCICQPIIKEGFHTYIYMYISKNPFLKPVMKILVLLAIILEVCKHQKQKIRVYLCPRSSVEFFTALVKDLVHTHLNHDIIKKQQGLLLFLFQHLPNKLYLKINVIVKVEAKGMNKHRSFIPQVLCKTLGLMHANALELSTDKHQVSYSFLLLTTQEFLAALYWCQVLLPKQLTNKARLPYINEHGEYELQLANVHLLYCNLPSIEFHKSQSKQNSFLEKKKSAMKCVASTSMRCFSIKPHQTFHHFQEIVFAGHLHNHCFDAGEEVLLLNIHVVCNKLIPISFPI